MITHLNHEPDGARSPSEAQHKPVTHGAAHWEAFFANARDVILAVDRDGEVSAASRRVHALTGLTPEEAVGRKFWTFFPASEEPAHRQLLERTLRGELTETEVRLQLSGKTCWFSIALQPLKPNGKVLGAHVVVRDVTQQKELQARLIQTEKLASVGQIAAGVAHEINNPLAYVLANQNVLKESVQAIRDVLSELRNGGSDEERSRIQAVIARSKLDDLLEELSSVARDSIEGADRIRRITRELRTLSRVDEDDVEFVDLNAVVNGTINVVFNEIRHRARLEKHLGELPRIAVSPGRASQVVLNLLVNAAHAVPDGRADLNVISIRTECDSHQVRISISDTGIGMSPEVRERIFEPFFTTKPKGIGTGLGLAISHEIIAGYGGDILVDSTLGKGTTFTIVLPVETGRIPRQAVSAPANLRATTRRARVLLIDDEPQLLRAYVRMLERAHDVVSACGGQEALRILGQGSAFDVVICDLMMPEMSGMDVHAAIQAGWPRLAERMVFATGGAFSSGAKEFIERVPNLRVDKPFDLAQLLAIISQLASGA